MLFRSPQRFPLPKGRVSLPGGGFHPYDFSFSGLKTAMLRLVERQRQAPEPFPLADLAASFERVVAEVLVERSCRCARDQALGTLVLVGGVAANRRLRGLLERRAAAEGLICRVAPLAWCTDNAAMIAVAAEQRLLAGRQSALDLGVTARLPLEEADVLYASPPRF